MMKKVLTIFRKIAAALLLIISAGVHAQVWVESPLSTNDALTNDNSRAASEFVLGSIYDTLSIQSEKGFFDDFSNDGPYPDTSLWLNNYVFINRDLPIAPPTLGVATFDGVNAGGYPYNFLASSSSTGKADTLTSKPIDLNYPLDTSIYLSFYYQGQGRGNFPDLPDSLILEFKAAQTGVWHHVWAKKGFSSAVSDSAWTKVVIHITDPKFLKKGFQFRFSNWATLSGNGDHWHIDYVRLQTAFKYILEDDAFVYNTPSLIQKYTAMPWRHYDSLSFKKQTYSVFIRNNDVVQHNGDYSYKIFDPNNIQVNTTYSASMNLDPFSTSGYVTFPPMPSPPINFTIPSPLTGPSVYTIESALDSANNLTFHSDTVRHKQVFDNYFAYDDGTAEISFGMQGALHAQLAAQFATTVADTLRCMDIYFNPQWTNASAYTFTLKVWAHSATGPGATIYQNPTVDIPEYNQSGHNKFTRYYFDQPVYLTGNTTFYIGFDQNTTQPINIGVDMNTDSQDYLYYNTSGSWQHPPFSGSLMMRPILGSAAEVVGINSPDVVKNEFVIYPNPAQNVLNLSYAFSEQLSFEIFDISGRVLQTGMISNGTPADISELSYGVYFIRLTYGDHSAVKKFVKSKI